MVIYVEQSADCLHMVQPMPLLPKTPSSLASFKSKLALPFWYQIIQVVLKKRFFSLDKCSSSSSCDMQSVFHSYTPQVPKTVTTQHSNSDVMLRYKHTQRTVL